MSEILTDEDKEIYDTTMISFLEAFKDELTNERPIDPTSDSWFYFSGTIGWVRALHKAADKCLPEIWPLYVKLDWWASDMFDSWIIDCAAYIGVIQNNTENEEEAGHEQD